MNRAVPLLVLLATLAAAPSAASHGEAAPASDENTWSADRGLKLSATVLADMDLDIREPGERTVRVRDEAAARVIAAGARARCVADVSAEARGAWAAGTRITLAGIRRLPGAAFPGGVSGADRTLAAATGRVAVLLDVEDPARRLALGDVATVRTAERTWHGVFLPARAIVERNGGTFCYVENEDRLQRTAIVPGRRTAAWVEVLDGILAGDRVVTGDASHLWIAELRAATSGGRCCPL